MLWIIAKQMNLITLLANNVDFVQLKEYVKLINLTEKSMTEEVQSPTLTLDGKDYLEADLSKEQMELLNTVKFLEPQIQELNNKLYVLNDHKARLINDLKQSLESGVEEATIIETKEIKDESS